MNEKTAETSHSSVEPGRLTHVDPQGRARMVDVGDKPVSQRLASATAICVMNAVTAQAIRDNSMSKGDVLQVARLGRNHSSQENR